MFHLKKSDNMLFYACMVSTLDQVTYSICMSVIYVFMAIVGIVGNVVTCIVIIGNKFMHTATNCYLLNLAVTDLIILIVANPVYHLIPRDSDIHCKLR